MLRHRGLHDVQQAGEDHPGQAGQTHLRHDEQEVEPENVAADHDRLPPGLQSPLEVEAEKSLIPGVGSGAQHELQEGPEELVR